MGQEGQVGKGSEERVGYSYLEWFLIICIVISFVAVIRVNDGLSADLAAAEDKITDLKKDLKSYEESLGTERVQAQEHKSEAAGFGMKLVHALHELGHKHPEDFHAAMQAANKAHHADGVVSATGEVRLYSDKFDELMEQPFTEILSCTQEMNGSAPAP